MEQALTGETGSKPVPLVAVVTNPASSTMIKRLPKVRDWVERSIGVLHYELDTIDDVDDALDFFEHAKPDVIVINGGDGTVGAVLQSILYNNILTSLPPIAIVPGGKTNMTGADLGIKGKPEVVLEKILQCVRSDDFNAHITRRNLIELDLQDGSQPRVGTFFGTAGIVRGIHWTRENAHKPNRPVWISHLVALFVLFTAGLGLSRKNREIMTSMPMEVYVMNGGRMRGRFASVLATTLDDLIFGLRPYGKEGKGGLRFSAIEPGAGTFFRALKGLVTGSFGKKGIVGVHVRRSDKISIKGEEPITLDGEMFFPKPDQEVILRGDKSLQFVSFKKADIHHDDE